MTFVPQTLGVKDCTDPVVTGTPSTRFDFIQKVSNNDANDVNAVGGQCRVILAEACSV